MPFFSELFFESLIEIAASPERSKFIRILCFLFVTSMFVLAIGNMVLLIMVIEKTLWVRIFYVFLALSGSIYYISLLKRFFV